MDVTLSITGDTILLNVDAADKWALLERMVAVICAQPAIASQSGLTPDMVRDAVLQHEREGATGLSDGVALPHARIAGFQGFGFCLAFLNRPVDFQAPDGVPTRIVCLLLVPDDEPTLYLKVVARLAQLRIDGTIMAKLALEDDAEEIAAYIREFLRKTDFPIEARHIMRVPKTSIYPETPLREVTRIMNELGMDAVSVVDHDETIVGEITTDALFRLGMPEFFTHLKTIDFISEYDPMEHYFARERGTRARDVMSQDYAALPEDATLLQVVFALGVKGHPKVYVVRDGKRLGVIDRSQVMNRVMNI